MLREDHRGNIQPELDLEEHDGLLFAKKVSLVSSATIFVNIGAGQATITHVGLVTLAPSPSFIGLVTTIPTYLSTYTSFATVISALATIIVPPSNQRIVLKDIIISSLGNTEMSVWAARSNATINMIPPSSLATTGGYISNFGDSGLRWPATNDALTLRSGATIGIMVNVKFET